MMNCISLFQWIFYNLAIAMIAHHTRADVAVIDRMCPMVIVLMNEVNGSFIL